MQRMSIMMYNRLKNSLTSVKGEKVSSILSQISKSATCCVIQLFKRWFTLVLKASLCSTSSITFSSVSLSSSPLTALKFNVNATTVCCATPQSNKALYTMFLQLCPEVLRLSNKLIIESVVYT